MDAVDLVLNTAAANNAWSAQQAEKQMQFQERMSNTAHQRQIADLKAAGINPVLSAKLGGASTPSGAMGDTDTAVTTALLQAIESVASGAASGAAYGGRRSSAKVAGDDNEFLYDALHALADALPSNWRKAAHSAVDVAKKYNLDSYINLSSVGDQGAKSLLQKAGEGIRNVTASVKDWWSKNKPSGEVKHYTDYGKSQSKKSEPPKTKTSGR